MARLPDDEAPPLGALLPGTHQALLLVPLDPWRTSRGKAASLLLPAEARRVRPPKREGQRGRPQSGQKHLQQGPGLQWAQYAGCWKNAEAPGLFLDLGSFCASASLNIK